MLCASDILYIVCVPVDWVCGMHEKDLLNNFLTHRQIIFAWDHNKEHREGEWMQQSRKVSCLGLRHSSLPSLVSFVTLQ